MPFPPFMLQKHHYVVSRCSYELISIIFDFENHLPQEKMYIIYTYVHIYVSYKRELYRNQMKDASPPYKIRTTPLYNNTNFQNINTIVSQFKFLVLSDPSKLYCSLLSCIFNYVLVTLR